MKLCFYFTGSIDKSTRDIELQMFGHEQMLDGSSSDVIKQLSEVTVRDEAEVETTSTTQVITCDVLQRLCTLLADCSFQECLSTLQLFGLRKKLSLE